MNQELIDVCPFREKTSSRRLYLVLARTDMPMTKGAIAKAAHLTVAKTATLLAAYLNPMHKAPLDRIGVRLVRTREGNFMLESCKPKPNAKRPARGEGKHVAKGVNTKLPFKPKASKNGKASPRKRTTQPVVPSEILAESPLTVTETNHTDEPVSKSLA